MPEKVKHTLSQIYTELNLSVTSLNVGLIYTQSSNLLVAFTAPISRRLTSTHLRGNIIKVNGANN